MVKALPIHNSIRILLINTDKEVLLMCSTDPETKSKDGTRLVRLWFTVGGQGEPGESPIETARRELYEETGIDRDRVTFGPIVWFGAFEMFLSGRLTQLKQQFIVAHTTQKSLTTKRHTEREKEVIEEMRWFSLSQICNCDELIYPAGLKDYLPNILEGNYPEEPIEIDPGG